MNKEEILLEIVKESPDWLAISEAAKAIYESNKVTSIGFLTGHINVVKGPDHSLKDISNELKTCIPEAEYYVVGGWSGITVSKFNKILPTLVDKFVIVVTDKTQVISNLTKNKMLFRYFTFNIRGKWDNKKTTFLYLKGEGVDIKAEMGNLKSVARDILLQKILE